MTFKNNHQLKLSIMKSFSSKNNFSLYRDTLQISDEKVWSFNYFLVLFFFLHVWGGIYFLSCREVAWDHFWWFFWFRSHIRLSCRFLWIPPYPFLDSYNQLIWSSSAWSSTPRTVFRCTKLLKYFQNMVNCGFGHLQEINNLWVCPSRAMKLNYCLSFARFLKV